MRIELSGFLKRSLYFVVSINLSIAASADSSMGIGRRLESGQFLESPLGSARLVMQADGNLVVYDLTLNLARWCSGTRAGGAFCVLQNDGNLVIYSASGAPLWSSGTMGKPVQECALADDGRITLNGPQGLIWQNRSKEATLLASVAIAINQEHENQIQVQKARDVEARRRADEDEHSRAIASSQQLKVPTQVQQQPILLQSAPVQAEPPNPLAPNCKWKLPQTRRNSANWKQKGRADVIVTVYPSGDFYIRGGSVPGMIFGNSARLCLRVFAANGVRETDGSGDQPIWSEAIKCGVGGAGFARRAEYRGKIPATIFRRMAYFEAEVFEGP